MMHPILAVRRLNRLERSLVNALLRTDGPLSQAALMSELSGSESQSTISRSMTGLIEKGLVEKEGQTRGSRFSLTEDARRFATHPGLRSPIPYQPERIHDYEPNVTRWLPEEAASRMRSSIDDGGGVRLDASTYSRAIAERFLIDLSWASSALEGNTYDLLSTEILIKYGDEASGSARLETAMILNHKNAISMMLERLDGPMVDAGGVKRLHALMMRDLMDPFDVGAIRKGAVGISSTSYRPSSDPRELEFDLSILLAKSGMVEDPLEASFMLMAGTSYLQAFGDGNKRMGRLLCNDPLLRAGLPPLSFVGADKTGYTLGLIDFYETANTGLLSEVVSASYATTAASYLEAVTAHRVPDSLELRERVRISAAMKHIFSEDVPSSDFPDLVQRNFAHLPDADRTKMETILVEISETASPASAVLYGVSEEDILRRRETDGPSPFDT